MNIAIESLRKEKNTLLDFIEELQRKDNSRVNEF
jgi:hypothetical protein